MLNLPLAPVVLLFVVLAALELATVFARLDLMLPLLSSYKLVFAASFCRLSAPASAKPPRTLTRLSSAGSDAMRFVAAARAFRLFNWAALGGPLARAGLSPINTSAGTVLERWANALSRTWP